uniref:Late embryogenesis abundant protein LEA-2 subgroup domain-containing protein n=1 Tax=Arundo donax TaxID=35708 RepID=A0A0A9C5M9_ARUDO
MVITVGLRPENIYLWILHGHVEAHLVWLEGIKPMSNSKHPAGRVSFGDILQPIRGVEPVEREVIMKYVDLRVSLSANNPSGRVDIYGNKIAVRVLDMPYNNFTGMVEILTFDLTVDLFTLRRQNTHTLMKWASVNNTNVLSYIATKYGREWRFTAMVQVNATISSHTVFRKTRQRVVTHYCWPVTVGLEMPSLHAKAVGCRWGEDMADSPVYFTQPPASAPGPSPALTGATG